MGKLPHQLAGKMLLGFAFAAQAPAAFGQSVDLGALTLAQSEQLLRSRNRELLAARRAVEAAQANTLSAGARPNPTLSLGVAAINPSVGVGAGPLRDKIVDSSIRIDQIIERGDRRRAQLALAYLIGAEAKASDVRAVDPWPPLAVLEGAGVADELIERRPDVRAAKIRVEAAQKARDLARGLRTRDVTVGAQFDHYPINPSYALGSGAGNGNTYGIFMSIPLFARYYYEGEIQRAEVDYNAALEALDKVR